MGSPLTEVVGGFAQGQALELMVGVEVNSEAALELWAAPETEASEERC